MNVLIIEDEARAANHLERLINNVDNQMNIVAKLESVQETLRFFKMKPDLQLIFSDIQLGDGLSFEIFDEVDVNCPIIFTTAYDKYAIDAFNTNGIDYLLKPIEEDRLLKAIGKLKSLQKDRNIRSLLQDAQLMPSHKSRFMVKVGDKIKSIVTDDIKLFYSQNKGTYLLTKSNRNYNIDYSLDDLQSLISDEMFFKISRKFIVAFNSYDSIISYSNSRLKLNITGIDDEVIVARERVPDFKKWLDR